MVNPLIRFFSLYLLLPLSIFSKTDEKKYYLSIVAIFQNEARYLKEWIEFHKLLGVEHFYLFNNLSADNFKDVLKPYIKNGLVELFDWPITNNCHRRFVSTQISSYQKIIEKNETFWLAMIDIDEFLFPTTQNNLTDLLKEYEDYAGICVNWELFGTSYIDYILDNELLIEKLTLKCEKPNLEFCKQVKSIVQPQYVLYSKNAHSCIYKKGFFCVNENKIKPQFMSSNHISSKIICNEKIRINHYWTRDEYFFKYHKLARKKRIQGDKYSYIYWMKSRLNAKYDDTIFRFIPSLKKNMEECIYD